VFVGTDASAVDEGNRVSRKVLRGWTPAATVKRNKNPGGRMAANAFGRPSPKSVRGQVRMS
jgi:hypothetical protein